MRYQKQGGYWLPPRVTRSPPEQARTAPTLNNPTYFCLPARTVWGKSRAQLVTEQASRHWVLSLKGRPRASDHGVVAHDRLGHIGFNKEISSFETVFNAKV